MNYQVLESKSSFSTSISFLLSPSSLLVYQQCCLDIGIHVEFNFQDQDVQSEPQNLIHPAINSFSVVFILLHPKTILTMLKFSFPFTNQSTHRTKETNMCYIDKILLHGYFFIQFRALVKNIYPEGQSKRQVHVWSIT